MPAVDPPRHAIEQLQQAIAFTPVPSRRPAYSRADEVSGLTMLELALRLDHISRATENLRLLDRGHLQRSVSVDVDLRMLTTRQREALQVRRPHDAAPPQSSADGRLWIPIARQSRDRLAAVTIVDSSGTVVPRLTSQATAEIMIAGMARLLRIQVDSRMAQRTGRGADLLSVRARWLVERGMAHLIRHGYDVDLAPDDGDFPGDDADENLRGLREEAHGYLAQLPRHHAEDFDWLLDVAVNEQLLIAMVPTGAAYAHLTFEAPPVPAQRRPLTLRGTVRRFLWSGRDLTVTYRTQIPRIVRSYHLSVEAPEEIHVRRFLLATDADRKAVEYLIHDLEQLSGFAGADGFEQDAARDVYRAELHDALTRCAALARLRQADMVHYLRYLARTFRDFGDPSPRLPDGAGLTVEGLVGDLTAGRCSFRHLCSLAYHHERGTLVGLGATSSWPLATALRTLADYLGSAELAFDLSLDNDPRENGSHTYWAKVELPFGPRPTEPVNAEAHLDLADEPPALIGSVAWMVAAVLGVVLLLHRLAPCGTGQADAAVTVLLLVPGILISRLDIPSTHSVLGMLRADPRRIAYACVVVTTVLSIAVASETRSIERWFYGATGLLAALLSACWAQIRGRVTSRRVLAPGSFVAPRWLAEALGLPKDWSRDDADLHFDAIEAEHATNRDPRPRISSAGHPIETVTSAARTAGERATGVAFTVVHRYITADSPEVDPAFTALGGPPDGATERTVLGTVGTTAFGTTCEVTVALDSDPRALDSDHFLTDLRVDGRPGCSWVRAVTPISSTYPGALRNVNEILFQLGTDPDLRGRQSVLLARFLARLADLCQETHAVPVTLFAPAAPPPATTPERTELAGLAAGPFVRLALSNSREHGDARIAFQVAACDASRELGIGVHLSAGRAGFGTRNWEAVVPFDERRCAQTLETLDGTISPDQPHEQVMLTLVAPTSARTTDSLFRLARVVRDLGIGLHAVSAWQVHRTTFTHLLLPRTCQDPGVEIDDVHRDPVAFLAEQCGTARARRRTSRGVNWPEDLRIVLADVVPLPNRPDTGRWVVPFWVAWDLPAGVTDVQRLSRHLMAAFSALRDPRDALPHAWVTYVHARSTGRDRWRGRAKLAVDVPPEWIRDNRTDALGTLAKQVQESVLTTVLTESGAPVHAVHLHVAWRERWLGRPIDW